MSGWVRAGLLVGALGAAVWLALPSDAVPLAYQPPRISAEKTERSSKAQRQRRALDELKQRFARPTRTVKVHVVDCGREAAVHADVSVLAGGEQVAGMTDELGVFRAPVPEDAGEVTASASLAAHHGMGGGASEVEVVICPGATVEGVVKDEAGRPLRDAVVRFGSGEDVAVTEDDGEFVLSDQYLVAGRITVEHPSGVAELVLDPALKEGEARQVAITISEGRKVVGQVFDAKGALAPNVPVTVVDRAGAVLARVSSDRDGRFWLAKVPFDQVVVKADGGQRGTAEVTLAVTQGELTLRLSADRTTLVVYWEGSLPGDIHVTSGGTTQSVASGAESVLVAPAQVHVEVQTVEGTVVCGDAVLLGGERRELRCGKPRNAIVAGRLVDVRGRPVANAHWAARIESHGMRSTLDGMTDGAGRFQVQYLGDTATTAVLELGLDDPNLDPIERRNVPVVPGQTTDLGALTMRDPAQVAAMFDEERSTGTFGGLGGQLTNDDLGIAFSRIVRDGPLSQAGVRAGDVILEIDGNNASTLTTREAMLKLRGKAGTGVELRLFRPGEGQLELELERAVIDPRGSNWVD